MQAIERLSLKLKVKWSCHLIEMCIIWIERIVFPDSPGTDVYISSSGLSLKM